MQHSESGARISGKTLNPMEAGSGFAASDAAGLTPAGQGRRTFIGAAAAALFAGVAIQITGCSTDDKDEPDTGGAASGTVFSNHPAPHKAVITRAQLDAGGEITLDIQGSSDHPHSLMLNADQVAAIKAGEHAMTSSTSNASPGGASHAHVVMFN